VEEEGPSLSVRRISASLCALLFGLGRKNMGMSADENKTARQKKERNRPNISI
jgi:hypothetical protein